MCLLVSELNISLLRLGTGSTIHHTLLSSIISGADYCYHYHLHLSFFPSHSVLSQFPSQSHIHLSHSLKTISCHSGKLRTSFYHTLSFLHTCLLLVTLLFLIVIIFFEISQFRRNLSPDAWRALFSMLLWWEYRNQNVQGF